MGVFVGMPSEGNAELHQSFTHPMFSLVCMHTIEAVFIGRNQSTVLSIPEE